MGKRSQGDARSLSVRNGEEHHSLPRSYNIVVTVLSHSAAPEGRISNTLDSTRWEAELSLACKRVANKSLITERQHRGPLRLLKPLYPEGDAVCHAVIVHPPGGIVAGDTLSLRVHVSADGHLLVTTPGSQKWYRSNELNTLAAATSEIVVRDGGALEWLPQETMMFNGACVSQQLSIHIDSTARFFGWEIVCLGRTARNECFSAGHFRQKIEIIRNGEPLWIEQLSIRGNDPLLTSPLGMGGQPVMGTAWIVQPFESENSNTTLLATVREYLAAHPAAAASSPAPGMIAIKVVSDSVESVRDLLGALWSTIREEIFSVRPHTPRIWRT
jgi:urease accessory protein